jgi:hypothetical protein
MENEKWDTGGIWFASLGFSTFSLPFEFLKEGVKNTARRKCKGLGVRDGTYSTHGTYVDCERHLCDFVVEAVESPLVFFEFFEFFDTLCVFEKKGIDCGLARRGSADAWAHLACLAENMPTASEGMPPKSNTLTAQRSVPRTERTGGTAERAEYGKKSLWESD